MRRSEFTKATARPQCPACGAQNRPRADGQGDVIYIIVNERGHCECTVCSHLWIHKNETAP